jgi:hypothetical protein
VREVARLKHYSLRTERTYCDWVRQFILFHGKRHPETMGAEEVRDFLTYLAVKREVAVATLSTTMIYTHVLDKPGIGVRSPLD